MFMRFRGGGVGHKSIQKKIQKFCDDRWPEELNDTEHPIKTTDDSAAAEQLSPDDGGGEVVVRERSSLGPIDFDGDDIEIPDVESELDSEDGFEDEGNELGNEGDEAESDVDLEYADY